jgi:DNA primase
MNVKVLLLPDGDDPDSFSRKMPADDLRKYIADHETDFIRFKTNLLLEEAKNDPIKRATLIQDIVKTISTIPDPIVRSVYVKECSNLLNVSEDVLYSELGKIHQKNKEQAANRRPADESPASVQVVAPASSVITDSFTTQNPFELEEREVLRFLIKYGNYPLVQKEGSDDPDEFISVGQFIVKELKIDDLQSVNPVFNKMLAEYEVNHENTVPASDRFFITHADMAISQLASDLISREYTLSKIHQRFGNPKPEEEMLTDLVPKVVLELKNRKVLSILDDNRRKLKAAQEAKDEERMMQLMVDNQKWQNVKKVIARELGGRTIVR